MASKVFEFKPVKLDDLDFTVGDAKIRCITDPTLRPSGLDLLGFVAGMQSDNATDQVKAIRDLFNAVVEPDDREAFLKATRALSIANQVEIAGYVIGEYLRVPTQPPSSS